MHNELVLPPSLVSQAIETREYQVRIIHKVMEAIKDGHTAILIEGPTGSGKTVTGHMIAKLLREEYGWRTGWTAMRKHLLHQAAEENERTLNEPINYFSSFDKHLPVGEIDVLIEDECHHAASETSVTVFKTLNPKIYIGLTATPFRTDRMKLCFSKVIKDAGTRALIDAGYLSGFHQYIFNEIWSPQSVASIYLNDIEKWGKTVMFFLTEVECNACAELLRAKDVRCEVVTGSSDQEHQISMFEDGVVTVLLNMVVLTEGFNSPSLKTVFVRPSSKGPTIQMGGRALRKYPGKKFAQIVQSHCTHWPMVKIASSEAKFIYENGRWQERNSNKKADAAAMASIKAIASSDVKLPAWIVTNRKKKKR